MDQFKNAFDSLSKEQQERLITFASEFNTLKEMTDKFTGVQLAREIGYGGLNDNLFKALYYIFQQRKK